MSVDNRIINMEFNNSAFEKGIQKSTESLDRLKQSLKFDQAIGSLAGIESAVNSWDLSGASNGVSTIADRFSTLGIVGMQVLRNLTDSAMRMGSKMASFFTTPIFEGGERRALNLEQARFQFQGLGMDIDKAMEDALYGVKDTAYGLDEAAKVVAQLGASGVELGVDMKSAARGISGVAAMTNSSYEDIGRIFTTVAGNGRLMGDQLNQLGSRGLNAAAILAKSFGVTEGALRKMVSKGEVSFDEFSKAMDGAFGEQATKANETFTGSLSNLKAALSRIGAAFYAIKLVYMRDIFNSITPVIDAIGKAMKPVVAIFDTLFALFRDKAVSMFNFFADPSLFEGKEIAGWGEHAKDIFLGLGAAFEIVTDFLISFGKAIGKSMGIFEPFKDTFLFIAASVGRFLQNMRDAQNESNGFSKAFAAIGRFLSPLGDVIEALGDGFARLTSLLINGKERTERIFGPLSDEFTAMADTLALLKKSISDISFDFSFLSGLTDTLVDKFKYLVGVAKTVASEIAAAFSNVLRTGDIGGLMDLVNTGLLAMLLKWIKDFVFTGEKLMNNMDVLGKIKFTFLGLQRALKSLTIALNAKTLIKIASAIAILVASIVVLSMIDPIKLGAALAALGAATAQLMFAMNILANMSTGAKMLQLGGLTTALIGLAVAMLILSFAVKKLSSIPWEEMKKGLIATGSLLTMLTIASKYLKGMKFGSALGFIALAVALNILASAVKKFGDIEPARLTNGLLAVGVVLAELALFTKVAKGSKGMITTGIGLLILSAALLVLTKSIEQLGNMDLIVLGTGLGAMAAALLILAVAMRAMPNSTKTLRTSVALILLGTALGILTTVLEKLGQMPIKTIGIGLIAMSTMLGIIAGALWLMKSTLIGTAALVVATGALLVLAGVLKIFGSMSLMEIGAGLLAIAGVFTVLGLAALILKPLTFTILSLSAAIGIFGAGMFLFGAGVAAFATGVIALMGAAVAIVTGLELILKTIIMFIPVILAAFAQGVINFVQVLADGAPKLAEAVKTIIIEFIKMVNDLTPVLLDAVIGFVNTFLNKLIEYQPKFMEQVNTMLLAVLNNIAEKLPLYMTAGADIIVAFLDGLGRELPRIIDAAFKMVIDFINGLAEAIRNNAKALRDAGWNLLTAVIEGITGGLLDIWDAGTEAAENFLEGLKSIPGKLWDAGVDFVSNVASGIASIPGKLWDAGKDIAGSLVTGFNRGVDEKASSVKAAATRMGNTASNALSRSIDVNSPSKVTQKFGGYFGQGFADGIQELAGKVKKSASNVGGTAVDALSKAISKVSDVMNTDMDFNPVITPVLDLTNMDTGLNSIDNAFSKQRGISVSMAQSKTAGIAGQFASSARMNVLAGAGGPNTSTATYNIKLGGEYHIREEADIQKISQELAREIERKRRA